MHYKDEKEVATQSSEGCAQAGQTNKTPEWGTSWEAPGTARRPERPEGKGKSGTRDSTRTVGASKDSYFTCSEKPCRGF